MESTNIGRVVSKRKVKVRKRRQSFAKIIAKFTIMIVGQKVKSRRDRQRERGLHNSRRKSWRKERWGIRNTWIVLKKESRRGKR